MARRKNAPDRVIVKCGVAERLRELRTERYGDRGGPEMARELEVPIRTWYNYESGVTVPAEIVLRVVEMMRVEPSWLLRGVGPKHRPQEPESLDDSIESLLKTAIERLERREVERANSATALPPLAASTEEGVLAAAAAPSIVLVDVDESNNGDGRVTENRPRYLAALREWQSEERRHRCLRVDDEAMHPLLAPGGYVAYSDEEADEAEFTTPQLDGKLVVAWKGDEPPIVRWFQAAGRFALLRSEQTIHGGGSALVDLENDSAWRFRVVSWLSTPR